jgi:hypothetical protein
LLEIAADQRLLLFAPPSFEVPFYFDCIGDSLKRLLVYQRHRPSPRRIAIEASRLVLSNTPFETPRVVPT